MISIKVSHLIVRARGVNLKIYVDDVLFAIAHRKSR
jgi:hypothetical protein